MATRYWVGGNGYWHKTATANWSATSGGAGGASAPTSADDVIFDANSGSGTCTPSYSGGRGVCKSITTTGYTGTIFGSFLGEIYVYGSITIGSGTTVSSGYNTQQFILCGSAGGNITTGGKSFRIFITSSSDLGGEVTQVPATGTWVLQDNLVHSSGNDAFLYIANGSTATLNLNSKQITYGKLQCGGGTVNFGACTGNFNSLQNTGTSTLNLNTSVLTVNGWAKTTGTLNAGTSTITMPGGGYNPDDGNPTWYNITVPASDISTGVSATNDITLSGASNIVSNGEIICGGTLTLSGSISQRILVRSATPGTYFYISATTLTATYVDFCDVFFGSGKSGAYFGDCGGNANITFSTPVTRYWVGSAGSWTRTDTTKWSATSGGASGASVPLAHDNVVFDSNSPAVQVVFNQNTLSYGKNITMTGWGGSLVKETDSTYVGIFTGNLTIPAGANASAANFIYLQGGASPAASTITVNSSVNNLTCYSKGGLSLQAPLTCNKFSTQGGTSYTNNYNVTLKTLSCSNEAGAAYGKLMCGTSTFTFTTTTGEMAFINMGSNNIDASSATFIVNPSAAPTGNLIWNFDTGAAFTIGQIIYQGSYNYTIEYQFETSIIATVGELINQKTAALTMTGPTTIGTLKINKWSCNGTAGNLVTLSSAKFQYAGADKVKGGYLSVSNSTGTPTLTWYAGTTSTDGGGNTGWTFTDPPSGNGLFFGSNF